MERIIDTVIVTMSKAELLQILFANSVAEEEEVIKDIDLDDDCNLIITLRKED